ncbi:MAG: ABC transporter permease [Candidatus Sericytochromatia bacterium]|nr:ABC transporter permease [Candidatus Sericytochromatia bacterium]
MLRWHRVLALCSRHAYLYRRSPFRIAELVYWPFLDLVLWGFLSVWLHRIGPGDTANFVALLLGGLILWDLLFRAQQGVSLAYLEEVWSRNLLNLFVTPLTVTEFLLATMTVSLVKLAFSVSVMACLAWALYGFNLLSLGLALVPFVAILTIFGWALGTVTTALVLRFGQGAESLAWVLAFVVQPIACVFYPVSTLPGWLQPVALALPAAHVFEGMRAVIAHEAFPWHHLATAAGLDLLFVAAAGGFFHLTFKLALTRGLLAKTGE